MANYKTLKRREQRKQTKKDIGMLAQATPDIIAEARGIPVEVNCICTGNTIAPTQAPPPYIMWWGKEKQEGNNPMYNKTNSAVAMVSAAPVSIEGTQRDYMIERLSRLNESKNDDLRDQFFFTEDRPRTAKELISRIKNDEFILDEELLVKNADEVKYYNNEYGIVWRKNKPDQEGFTAAMEEKKKVAQNALDVITLKSIDEAYQALKDFEAWVYTVSKQ